MTAYRIRRSARARRVRVTVHPDRTVEVTLPQRCPERDAAAAVRELQPWIDRKLRALERAAVDAPPRTPGTVPFVGEELTLVRESGRTRVHRRGDVLHVPEDHLSALERWYRAQARKIVAAKLDAATARAGTTYSGLTIRAQKTRWASCSSRGAMSFNWRLMLAPEAVLDYVVEHEVCHLEVLDHSPRFWALMAARVPDYRDHATWLRRYGATLSFDAL